MDLYREHILEHYRSPQNWGLRRKGGKGARQSNPVCGDEIEVELDFKEDVVQSMRFEGHGCAISIAAASLMSEAVRGQTLAAVQAMDIKDVEKLFGVLIRPGRHQCALLGLRAVQRCLEQPDYATP